MEDYNYKRLKPFKWFVLQNFPFIEEDFDALTNWELFCKLGNEMNKIIKNMNTLGTTVEEFTDYINSYFDNLDVQDEINNKLDEMAEDGTLSEIIAQYLQLNGVFAYDNINNMKSATNLIEGSICRTLGYINYYDGLGAFYRVRKVLNTDVIDNKNIIALSDNELIAELIIKPHELLSFNNVSNMVEFGNFNSGDTVQTLGFYSLNDKGGAKYKIRHLEDGESANGITLIELQDDLVAELIIESEMNVKQFGAYGDNETDDTLYIQTALNSCKNIVIENGTYLINIETTLAPDSNTNIKLNNGVLKAIPSDKGDISSNSTSIFNITEKENITIIGNNFTLQGERENHEDTNHQFGFGILIDSSDNIVIKNLSLINNTGDGIITQHNCSNILIDNVICNNNHRQGISLCGGNNIKVINSFLSNTNGTAPQAGIDLEPFGETFLTNITIDKCIFYHNTGNGIHGYNGGTSTYSYIDNVLITNCKFINGLDYGINIDSLYSGKIEITNNIFRNNTKGVRLNSAENYNFSNNLIDNINNIGLFLTFTKYGIISNNTFTNNTGVALQLSEGCSYNLIEGNHIHNNKVAGINLYAPSSGQPVQYNTISNNKIYDNSQNSVGTNDNIEVTTNSPSNTFDSNDFNSPNQTVRYNINFSAQGSVCYVKNNIMKTQLTGAMYLRSSYSLMNIIDNTLQKGNLFT